MCFHKGQRKRKFGCFNGRLCDLSHFFNLGRNPRTTYPENTAGKSSIIDKFINFFKLHVSIIIKTNNGYTIFIKIVKNDIKMLIQNIVYKIKLQEL